MGLMQKETAKLIGVNTRTILNWEKGRAAPPLASIPAIVQFLGYEPFPEPKTLPQHLLAKRRMMGWSIKEAANAVVIDPCTWGNWEHGKLILYRQHRTVVAQVLGFSVDTLNKEMEMPWNWSHERTL